MLDLLNTFQDQKKHLALVSNDPESVTEAWLKNKPIPPDVHMAGILTLEDIIEKLLQEEIEDEHDERKAVRMATMAEEKHGTSSKTMEKTGWKSAGNLQEMKESVLHEAKLHVPMPQRINSSPTLVP